MGSCRLIRASRASRPVLVSVPVEGSKMGVFATLPDLDWEALQPAKNAVNDANVLVAWFRGLA